MVMMPVPAAAAGAMVVVHRMLETHANIGTERADMSPDANALIACGRTGPDRADIGAGAGLLCRSRAGQKQCGRKCCCKKCLHRFSPEGFASQRKTRGSSAWFRASGV